jgi:hypothetical protein
LADLSIRRNEADAMCSGSHNLCGVTDRPTDGLENLDIDLIVPWDVEDAQAAFLKQYRTLTSTR